MRNFLFPAWDNCFQIYGEGCKGGLPYPGNSGNTAGNPGRSGIACGKRRNGKNRKKRGYKRVDADFQVNSLNEILGVLDED